MTTMTKRWFAGLLTVALLAVCVCSGITMTVAAAAPIIQNGDLEAGAVNGWEGASQYVKQGVGYNDSWGLHFAFQGWARVNYTSAENWNLEPNSTYRLTYLAKGQPLCAYFGTKTDVSGLSVSSGSKVLDGQWCTRIAYFTTQANPQIKNLYFGRTSGTTVGDSYVDNIVIEKVDKHLDRIVNGDMEMDSIAFWNSMGNTGVQYADDPVEGGNHGRVLTFTKSGQGYVNFMRYTKGRTFKLSFDHYGAAVSFFIDDIIDIDNTGWQRVDAHDEWTRYEFVFSTYNMDSVETSGDAAMYSFCFENGKGAYIDNMSLVELPCVESMTLSADELSLTPGRTMQLSYTLTPNDVDVQGGTLVWSTSDDSAVTVDQNGNIRAVGKAGTGAVITLSNKCLSASCNVSVAEEDKAVVSFMQNSGVGDYAVTNANYDKLIGAEEAWNALTAVQQARVSELLPAGRGYLDLLAVAKSKQEELAAEFVHHYAYNSANLPITEATFSTCLWIATAKDEWEAMSASTKAVVNAIAQDACGITFEQLYNESVALVPVTDPDDRPGANGGGAAADSSSAVGVTAEEYSGTVSVTGSRVLFGLFGAVVVAVLVAIAVVLRYRRRGVRVLSLFLVMCMAIGFVCVVPISTQAWSLTYDWIDPDETNIITDFAYSIAVVGDTQVITHKYPDDLSKIYDWILANKDSKKIGFVAGLGDITETNVTSEWSLAREQIMKLQGKIPFSIVEGNHDNSNGSTANMNTAFPVNDVFAGYAPGTYGVFEEGKIDNTYQLFEINGIQYMMIALEFGPRPEVLAWAGTICDQYYDRNVIVTTHAYLDGDANIMDKDSAGSPHLKGGHPTTYGTTIWDDLITTHDNIILAISGHVSADNFKVKQKVGKYGQVVTNLISNPQTIDDQIKPSGMVTMLYFSEDGTTMTVQDYSTIQQQFYGSAVTVTVDKAQHRHKASTNVYSSGEDTHWYACECGGRAEEAPHAWGAWTAVNGTTQQRVCVFCEYAETLVLGDIYQEVDLHRANFKLFSHDDTYHWLNCGCDEDNVIHKNLHNWTTWKKTGTTSSQGESIFSDDVPFTSTPFDAATNITTSAGTIDPNADTLAQTVGDELAAELKANIIADFEKDGDKMVHVSSFTIVDDIVYMTYYANTATAGEDASHLEARFAYCPLSNPDDMTVITVQKTGDTLEGRSITKVYDTILMDKNDGKIYIMWTAATTQYYRFYAVFDIATKTLGDIGVNRFKCGDVVNDMSISGIRSALLNNGYSTKYMNSDIGIMQKLSAREENGEIWYYTGMYCWQFNCIIKSKDLITWEFVAMPDFDNRSEYENATFVIGDKVYYFVRQFDGTNGTKDAYGFLTYYDLNAKTWATPVLVNDCQSRSDFFHYGGELYLVHAPKNRNGIGLLRIDQQNLANSQVVAVADMGAILGGSCFYPYTMVYGDTLYLSYTVIREHIRLAKCDLTKYLPKNGNSIVLPDSDPDDSVEDTTKEEYEHDTDIWERFCPCGASEQQLLPMGAPLETDTESNLIYGKVDRAYTIAGGGADITKTVNVSLKAGQRYVVRVTSRGAEGTLKFQNGAGTINMKQTENWRVYQYFFKPEADTETFTFTIHHKGATVRSLMVANVQLIEAPKDGSFNLFAGGDMNVETDFFGFDGDGGDGPYIGDRGTHTADPTDSANTALRLTFDQSYIFVLNQAFPGYTLPEGKMIEITFRRTGANVILRQGWGTTYSCSTSDATKGTAANEWTTYTWYLDPSAFNNGKEWMNLQINQYYGKGSYTDNVAYIDDIVIRERPFAESFSFKGETIKVNAVSGVQDLGDQLVVSPPNALPSSLTWTIENNTTLKYVESTGKFEGDPITAISLNGSAATVADLGSNGGMDSKWSLGNCEPIITVSDGTLTASAKVEWVYPETVFNVDVDTNASGRTDAYEIVDPTDPTNMVMSVPTNKDFTVYFTEKNVFLKPNTRYLLSYRSKATQGDSGRIYAYLTCSTDIYQHNTTKRASLVCSNTTSEWVTNTMLIETGAAPSADSLYSLMLQRYGGGTNDILVDDIKLEMVPDDYTMVVGGDFEMKAPTMAYYDRIIRNGLGTIVSDGDNHVLKLKAGVGRSGSTAFWGLEYLKTNTVYKVKFRQKGGQLVFHVAGGDGWASTIVNVGNPNGTYEASETWADRSFYFATGSAITNSGNWSSTIQLGTSNADVYLDDIVFEEVDTGVMVKATDPSRKGTVTVSAGGAESKLIPNIKAGETVKVTVKPNSGYLLDPASVTYTDRSGNVVPILNNPTPMTDTESGGTGYVFAFTMPADCVTIDANFVAADQNGYQWGTLGSTLHFNENDEADGLRFLNRLYIQGLDWDADDLTVTHGGKQYYVQQLGAIARPQTTDGSALTLDNDTLHGVCYTRGTSWVRVTDYTDTYLDFTVVIMDSEKTPITANYECRAYMTLVAVDNADETVTLYTTSRTDNSESIMERLNAQ